MYKKRPFSKKILFKNIGKYFCACILGHCVMYFLELESTGVWTEEIKNIQYVVGLFIIYSLYAIVV